MVLAVLYRGSSRIVDRRAGARYGGDGAIEQVGYAGIDATQRRRGPHRDAKLAEPATARRRQLDPPGRPLKQIRSGKRAQRQIEILGVTRHRADDGYVGRRHDARRRVAARRDQPPRRFVSIDAAVMRRVAQRAGYVAASAECREPGGECGSFAARRAAGRARRIPRVVGGAVDVVVALRVGEHEGHIGLAVHDGAGLQQAIDQEGVAGGDIVLPQRVAEGGRQTRDVERFLDGHRNAVQRSPAIAARKGGIGGACAFSRLVDLPDNDCVEPGVMAFRARQIEVEQLDAADAPVADLA